MLKAGLNLVVLVYVRTVRITDMGRWIKMEDKAEEARRKLKFIIEDAKIFIDHIYDGEVKDELELIIERIDMYVDKI
jgi:hypothetical protein